MSILQRRKIKIVVFQDPYEQGVIWVAKVLGTRKGEEIVAQGEDASAALTSLATTLCLDGAMRDQKDLEAEFKKREDALVALVANVETLLQNRMSATTKEKVMVESDLDIGTRYKVVGGKYKGSIVSLSHSEQTLVVDKNVPHDQPQRAAKVVLKNGKPVTILLAYLEPCIKTGGTVMQSVEPVPSVGGL